MDVVGAKEAMIYGQTIPRDLLKVPSSEPENQPLHERKDVRDNITLKWGELLRLTSRSFRALRSRNMSLELAF
jgi:hypothetical protein